MPKPPDNNAGNAFSLMVCEDTIADITEDTPRDERIAAAIALVRMGSSINNAADVTFLSPRTVWDRVNKDPKYLDDREKAIREKALEGILRAGERIETMMSIEDGEGRMRPSEVVRAYEAFARVAAQLGKWNTPPPPPPEEKQKTALQTLVEYAEHLRAERDRGTIDVTPEKKDAESPE